MDLGSEVVVKVAFCGTYGSAYIERPNLAEPSASSIHNRETDHMGAFRDVNKWKILV
jgi:hypothetical protein